MNALDIKAIEQNVTILHTPYCNFTITDDENNPIFFDIMESPAKDTKVYINNDAKQSIHVKYGAGKTLRIYTKNLETRKSYFIFPSKKLIFRDTDERLFTDGITGDDYTFAVSFPNPNEEVKLKSNYTEDDLRYYNIEQDNEKYILRLYDRVYEYIDIFAFWIWNVADHMDDYESACEVATWWCP